MSHDTKETISVLLLMLVLSVLGALAGIGIDRSANRQPILTAQHRHVGKLSRHGHIYFGRTKCGG